MAVVAVATSRGEAKPDPARLYRRACVDCHGPDGRANTSMGRELGARDLTARHTQDQSDGDLYAVIANGKGNMPGFDPRFNHEQIAALVGYVRELGKSGK